MPGHAAQWRSDSRHSRAAGASWMGWRCLMKPAVGKIAQEEIAYLMSRGLSEQEATSILIRGFFNY